MKKFISLTISVLLLASCKEAADFYLGIPLQPRFDENSYTPGLNIFGVVRPDSTGNYNNSFVEIQKVVPAVGSIDSLEVDTIKVTVSYITEGQGSGATKFVQSTFDNTFKQANYRPENTFVPKALQSFYLTCEHPSLPVLTATTMVPEKAVLVPGSIVTGDKYLAFEIQADTSIFMLDVYVFSSSDNLLFSQRYGTISGTSTKIELPINAGYAARAVIYSYDSNLAKYYLASNTSLNFNKYRKPYSTVENGYGVFGSVNISIFVLK
ncbi:MAG: hypothetical protein JXB34_06610 [Bacteroidales bacterium]|nr:hypothetical protein [Bacteroidales bacterium]